MFPHETLFNNFPVSWSSLERLIEFALTLSWDVKLCGDFPSVSWVTFYSGGVLPLLLRTSARLPGAPLSCWCPTSLSLHSWVWGNFPSQVSVSQGPVCLLLSYGREWDVVLVLRADSLAVGSGESPLGTLFPDSQLVSGGQLAPSQSCSFQALHISAAQPRQEGR